MSIDTLTFGCRLNSFETEVMKSAAGEAGLDNVLIINSCAVTAEAVRQARQSIRREKRLFPHRRIIVSGCAAQTESNRFGEMEEVDLVLGNNEKMDKSGYTGLTKAQDFGIGASEKIRVNDIMSVTETASHMVDGLEGRTRAFVQVQNGCDHRCTFCIIPFGRGPSRSVPMGVVVDQVQKLVDNGYKEVVLTGVDITSYGPDLPGAPSVGKLVQQLLLRVPDLPRLRISSIDSIEVDTALFDVLRSENRLMPHLHLSLQSGDNMILKRMKRRHLREHTIEFCHQVREMRPDIVFGADIIAGFPTETDEMFENSLRIVDECDLTYLHVFPYSPRENTPAARMPAVPRAVSKARAAQLRKKGELAVERHCAQQVGQIKKVLFEKDGIGRTEQFSPVQMGTARAGELLAVEIVSASEQVLVGMEHERVSA